MDNRPVVVFKGGIVHQSPYPQGRAPGLGVGLRRLLARLQGDLHLENGRLHALGNDPDPCRPQLDACDRSCQRDCRGLSGGPLLGFVDW